VSDRGNDEQAFDPQALIDAMEPFIGFRIPAQYRPGIALHLEVARAIAQDVLAFETSDEAEPAPVFRA